jgi:GTPase SAR1 family protein
VSCNWHSASKAGDQISPTAGEPVPTLLLGNKIDLLTQENWEQRRIEIEKYQQEKGFLAFFETSAKDGTNLEASIMCLVDYIMKNNIESESSRELNPGVDIVAGRSKPKEKKCC